MRQLLADNATLQAALAETRAQLEAARPSIAGSDGAVPCSLSCVRFAAQQVGDIVAGIGSCDMEAGHASQSKPARRFGTSGFWLGCMQ